MCLYKNKTLDIITASFFQRETRVTMGQLTQMKVT